MADEDMLNEKDYENLLNEDSNGEDTENIAEYVTPGERGDAAEDVPEKPEDLPLEKRLKLIKEMHNPFGTIRPGLWVDAIDSINAWLSSSIEEVDGTSIKVHFEGWPSKWDEWMRITSYKVAPFRKHSIGYTGQVRVALRKSDHDIFRPSGKLIS